jgi:colanic acid/amylovoran biosynthesis glycosyltransferase
MRIAFLLGQFPALSETFILDQITTLMDLGHVISIFAEGRSPDRTVHPDVEEYRLLKSTRYEDLPATFPRRVLRAPDKWKPSAPYFSAVNVARFGADAASLRLLWAAALFEGSRDFDIVQCHFGALGRKAALLRRAGALRGKIVTAFHGEDITNYPRQFRNNIYEPLFAEGDLFLPISARWNDALVALGCPSEKIRVHRMGVLPRHFSQCIPSAPDAGPLRVLSVSRLVEKKGIADAIEAVARAGPNVHLTIAGEGPLKAQLEQATAAAGAGNQVRFVGAQTRTQVAKLLQQTDLFIAPSVTSSDGDIEGIPVSIMEAMACGLPILSTKHSAIPDLVKDGESGFLVREHDVEALAERLNTLAADPQLRRSMGERGREIVTSEFNAESLTSRLVTMYHQLLQNS